MLHYRWNLDIYVFTYRVDERFTIKNTSHFCCPNGMIKCRCIHLPELQSHAKITQLLGFLCIIWWAIRGWLNKYIPRRICMLNYEKRPCILRIFSLRHYFTFRIMLLRKVLGVEPLVYLKKQMSCYPKPPTKKSHIRSSFKLRNSHPLSSVYWGVTL